MLPLNVPEDKLQILVNTFGSSIGSFPFTYLGLPMGTTKPRVQDFTPLIDKMERRLNGCSNFLSYSGRLQIVNSVMTPSIVNTMCTLKLPVGVIEQIDKLRKHCLWRGNNPPEKGRNRPAWEMVMKPKIKGVWVCLTWRPRILPYSSSNCINFTTRRMFHPWVELIWHKKSHMLAGKLDPSDGKMCFG